MKPLKIPPNKALAERFSKMHLILGDQLNCDHSWFENTDSSCLFVIAELQQETDYTLHHIQKVTAFFLAMENFASRLKRLGHQVLHLNLEETAQFDSLSDMIKMLCKHFKVEQFVYQRPDEIRLFQQLDALTIDDEVTITQCDSEHFLLPFEEISEHFQANKHTRMENFYRKMRLRFDLLIDEGKPAGGRWNFDSENRLKLKKADIDSIPRPLTFENDASAILQRLEANGTSTVGKQQSQSIWPKSREQSLELLAWFCEFALPNFGKFQDAMTENSPHGWSIYHARLSFSLNTKMLKPMEVIAAAIEAQAAAPEIISIEQLEGFVRQILGWREFIRGVYWANHKAYKSLNHFNAKRKLPTFYWNGNTKMSCMKSAIEQSLDYAYAHHIQRLMVTGNFAMLAGINPDEVDSWYLGIYIDAIEWVELPNTRGMSQFADGGIVGTKPYAASANYINKMSDHCSKCHYDRKEKIGADSCPFNSLYWRFMNKHRSELGKNQRLRMLFSSWDKLEESVRVQILDTADAHLANMNSL